MNDYVEWTTIPYRTARFWVVIGVMVLLVAILWHLTRHSPPGTGSERPQQADLLERRAARFVYIDGDVRVKAINSIEWVPADRVDQLYPGFLIRTSFNSSCRLVFFDGTSYEVKPNSLISILESYEDRTTAKRMVNVELAQGSLDLSTSSRNMPASRSKVETTNAIADMSENTQASASYDPKVGDAQFRVSRGLLELTTKDTQQRVEARTDQQLTVSGGRVTRRSLPPAPVLVEPSPSQVFTADNPKQVRVRLSWRKVDPTYQYRLVLSNHQNFYHKIHEEVVRSASHTIDGLPYGVYYWRVTAIDAQGGEGAATDPAGLFAIRPRKLNPAESIRFELERVVPIGDILELFGRTDPDNQVIINGRRVFIEPSGTFKHFTQPFTNQPIAELRIMVRDYSGAERVITHSIKLD